jgi:hypothetical protein
MTPKRSSLQAHLKLIKVHQIILRSSQEGLKKFIRKVSLSVHKKFMRSSLEVDKLVRRLHNASKVLRILKEYCKMIARISLDTFKKSQEVC